MGSYNLVISLYVPKITIFRQFSGDNTFFVFFGRARNANQELKFFLLFTNNSIINFWVMVQSFLPYFGVVTTKKLIFPDFQISFLDFEVQFRPLKLLRLS